MRFGFVGPSYTVQSSAVADEECINLFPQSVESQGAIVPISAYGGKNAAGLKAFFRTPGYAVFATLPNSASVRGSCWTGQRFFVVGGGQLYELSSAGGITPWGAIANDGNPASLAFNGLQVLVISGLKAYCFTLSSNSLVEVTSQLAGVPVKCDYSDTYFIVMFQNSNKYQMSQVLDGTTWPGQLVNEVSVFAENIVSILCNHRELGVLGQIRSQPYQDTGSAEIFDVIPGALIETGCAATFSPALLDNSWFWMGQDARGCCVAYRSNGYTPQRISTYAVEMDLQSYTVQQIAGIVSYTYQDSGHLFWVLYIPGAQWSWVFDVVESLWHKRAEWNPATSQWSPHYSWNHAFAFGMHLVGDWNSGNVYQMSLEDFQANGNDIRWLRRAPTVGEEMARKFHAELTIDFETGVGPQPPLTDGAGNPRPPQAMLRWSDDRGKTWSNQHILSLGFAGQYKTRAIQRRLGVSRYRVYEVSGTDPVKIAIVDSYLRTTPSTAPQ